MKSIAAYQAQNQLRNILAIAQGEPVFIEEEGNTLGVLLSLEEYKRLEALEDAWWAMKADSAEQNKDWLTVEESEKFMKEILDA